MAIVIVKQEQTQKLMACLIAKQQMQMETQQQQPTPLSKERDLDKEAQYYWRETQKRLNQAIRNGIPFHSLDLDEELYRFICVTYLD